MLRMTQSLIILYIMYKLGAESTPCLVEDIAIEAFRTCPEHFALQKYPQYPNIEAVRKRLQSDMSKNALVTGNNKTGYLLTAYGTQVLSDKQAEIAQKHIIKTKKHHVSVTRITRSAGYNKEHPSQPEMLESLGCNINTTQGKIKEKLELYKTKAHVLQDEQLIKYLKLCEESLLK